MGAGAGASGAATLGAGAAGAGAAYGAGAGAAAGAGALTAEEIAAQQAAQLAAQQAAQSGMAGGANTMEGGLLDTGYTPSSLKNAVTLGPGSGQGMGTTMANYGRGLLSNATAPSATKAASKMATNMGAQGLMAQGQQQPQRTPMLGQSQQQQPMQMYGSQGGMYGMDEETKRKLRAMGYQV